MVLVLCCGVFVMAGVLWTCLPMLFTSQVCQVARQDTMTSILLSFGSQPKESTALWSMRYDSLSLAVYDMIHLYYLDRIHAY